VLRFYAAYNVRASAAAVLLQDPGGTCRGWRRA
jgi:hypothetical protein